MMSEEETLRQSALAMKQFEEKWKEHCSINGEIYRKSGRTLKDLSMHGIGRQLLICATGQSLEGHIELIKKYRHKVDIMCNDKSFGVLMDQGVVPEFCVIQDANVFWSWGDGRDTSRTTLIANINCNPDWTRNWKGPVYFHVNKDAIESEKIFSRISGCMELLPAASNVGNAAIVAAVMTFRYDRILLTGYDFAWYSGSNYYAFNDSDKRHWMRHRMITGIDGEICFTSENLFFSVRWMVDFMNRNFPKYPVFNCSGKGIMSWNPTDLGRRLEEWQNRTPHQEEISAMYNARIKTEQFQYAGPDDLLARAKNKKYLAGVILHYLPADISPAPEVAA